MSAQTATTVGRVAALGAAVALVASAIIGLVIVRGDASRVPTTSDVVAANQAIASQLAEGDAVRPVPAWFADARIGFGDWPILMGTAPDTWELHHFERVALVFPVTHEEAAEAEAVAMGLTDLEALFDANGYRAVRGSLPPVSPVVWDAADEVELALVSKWNSDREIERSCDRWMHDSWHCERFNAFLFVGARLREMGDQEPHRCVVMNAVEPPEAWRVKWSEVPAQGRSLRVRAGNTYEAVRAERGGPLLFEVVVDGDVAHARTYEIHDESYAEIRVPLPDTPTAEVELRLSTNDHFDRFFCAQAQVVDP